MIAAKDKEEKQQVPQVKEKEQAKSQHLLKSKPMSESTPEPTPTMIRLVEFMSSGAIRKEYKVETLGGFLNWVKDKAPIKLSFDNWKKLLDQFANRII
jgi:hypothetical protein